MSETIITALITGGLALLGSVISGRATTNKVMHQLDMAQAVTNTEVKELTREVREHNHFAQRMPVLEEQLKVANHRIDDLEKFHAPKN